MEEINICKHQWKYKDFPYPICGITFEPVICPLDFKSCPNRILIEKKKK